MQDTGAEPLRAVVIQPARQPVESGKAACTRPTGIAGDAFKLMQPARNLPLMETVGAPEVVEADGSIVQLMKAEQRIDHGQPHAPTHVAVGGVGQRQAGRGIGVEAIHRFHQVELRAQNGLVIAGGDQPRMGHPAARQRF